MTGHARSLLAGACLLEIGEQRSKQLVELSAVGRAERAQQPLLARLVEDAG